MNAYLRLLLSALGGVLLLLASSGPGSAAATGRIVDQLTGTPIRDAIVTLDSEVVEVNQEGVFPLPSTWSELAARAPGYLRASVAPSILHGVAPLEIRLTAFAPKALYLSGYGIANAGLRGSALALVAETEINALVIDVKGDRGQISYRSAVPMATEIGAQRVIPVKDMPGLMADLKQRGIYTIARIVVFKDAPLALARPELAVRSSSGGIWRDRENLAWTDPFRQEVWEYNIAIAEEAAQLGFDEIQFDYVRFPDASRLRFSQASTEQSRVEAISRFLEEARRRLVPYNVFVAADIFGYVCWNPGDTHIGQRLGELAARTDILAPMLYPSGFQFGIPGYVNPVQNPYPIVFLSLQRAQERTGLSPLRFRPWLQAFRDYAFDGRSFSGQPLRAQIDAAEKFGAHGWMLWNPSNVYSREGLRK